MKKIFLIVTLFLSTNSFAINSIIGTWHFTNYECENNTPLSPLFVKYLEKLSKIKAKNKITMTISENNIVSVYKVDANCEITSNEEYKMNESHLIRKFLDFSAVGSESCEKNTKEQMETIKEEVFYNEFLVSEDTLYIYKPLISSPVSPCENPNYRLIDVFKKANL